MKIKDEFKRLPKDLVYDIYITLVYNVKEYDKITRTKMLDEIIEEYKSEDYLYYICTKKELEFLKYASNKKLNKDDLTKYQLEIKSLHEKCIFSLATLDVFEEQKENVKNALKHNKDKQKENIEKIIIFMISLIKINGEMLTKALIHATSNMFSIDEERINPLLGHPLFHFYCDFRFEFIESINDEKEVAFYRDYWDILEELAEARIKYGMSGVKKNDIRDNYDIFYYGFPIRNKKVKRMYDEVGKLLEKDFLYTVINEARLLNDRTGINIFIKDEELKQIIFDALEEMPCAAMAGFTPKQYKENVVKDATLDKYISKTPQVNACLTEEAANRFYKLYFALLEYINNKYKIEPKIKKIYKQKNLNVNDLYEIYEYLWKNREVIDDFIKENLYKFSKSELEEIKEFKNATNEQFFIVAGFEEEYTKVLSNDGKLYMVKGLNSNIDEIIDKDELPKIIYTTLLMFDGNIIYNSFFRSLPVNLGSNFKKEVIEDCKKAIVHYHL